MKGGTGHVPSPKPLRSDMVTANKRGAGGVRQAPAPDILALDVALERLAAEDEVLALSDESECGLLDLDGGSQ